MAHIFTPALRRPLSKPFARSGTRTLIQRAIASLRARGTDAHLWLPGVGTLNGLTTGNYLESTGNTLATVDNPVGLVLDALGSVGAELFTSYSRNSTVETGTSGFPAVCTASAISAVVGIYKAGTANTPYRCSISWSGNVAGKPVLVGGGVALVTVSSAVSGSAEFTVVPSIANIYVYFASSAAGQSISIDSFSAKPVSGIHLTQGTTADKGILRLTDGRYNWVFDSTDKLSATIPAGWESATTIDAKSTGQVTLQSQNIVGAYLIGPSLTTYGRIILKTAPTASELALYQGFANKLAGL